MKILHVLETSFPNISGYSIRSGYIVESQKAHGLEPIVLTSPLHNDDGVGCKKINGIKYYRSAVSVSACKSRFSKRFYRYGLAARVLRKDLSILIKKEKPDIIHAHSFPGLGNAIINSLKYFSIPFVFELRGLIEEAYVAMGKFGSFSIRYNFLKQYDTQNLRSADAVVTISQALVREIASRGIRREKIYTVPNGVDTDVFGLRARDPHLVHKYGLDTFTWGYVGSLNGWDGLEYIIKAMPFILKQEPNVKAVFVGGGPQEDNLRQLTRNLNLERNIVFIGRVPHDEIVRYYSVFDLICTPRPNTRVSNVVTPLKPLESMACEIPLVVSNVGALREMVIDGQTGLFFKPEDEADLGRKVLALTRDEHMRSKLSRGGRKWVMENRSWSELVKTYTSLYRKLIHNAA